MTENQNQELNGAVPTFSETPPAADPAETSIPEAPASEAPAHTKEGPVSEPTSASASDVSNAAPEHGSFTPQLTLEPDPVPPEIPDPQEACPPVSTAQAFHMPEPPRAPEPPQPEPAQQPTVPNFTQPPYSAPVYQPQYQTTYYGQPVQPAQYGKQLYNTPPVGYTQKSRLAAGLLGLLFGVFGIHNFYLGFNSRAVTQLVVSLAGGLLTCGLATVAMSIWGFIEGILILSANSPSRRYDGNGVILRD